MCARTVAESLRSMRKRLSTEDTQDRMDSGSGKTTAPSTRLLISSKTCEDIYEDWKSQTENLDLRSGSAKNQKLKAGTNDRNNNRKPDPYDGRARVD